MANENDHERILKYLPYLSIFLLLIVWELIVDLGVVPKTLLASPVQVVKLFFLKLNMADPDGAVLSVHIWTSLKEALLGYLLALAIGIPLGLAMGWFVVVEGLARPIFEMIRPIPPVAWIPLAIFWFGIGLPGKVFIIWASGVVPCVINSFVGVRMTNPTFIRMARTYGASDWEIFKQICIPSALPMVFGGLQVALAASWTALVAAELIAADTGLGFLITMGRRLLMPDMIVLGMIMVGLTGVVIGIIVDRIERKLVAGVRR
ncbi:ABC transporter permease [Desulforamulus ruminis]|uniref:ABC transporter permease n=1 Tax=Desulforamulus ruminis TaxID=1564 RepID=UPI0023560B8A|nr:ABC transporter permease [Desulforamulus ruminis]